MFETVETMLHLLGSGLTSQSLNQAASAALGQIQLTHPRLPNLATDSGSQKMQHAFDGFNKILKSSSLTIDGPPENSSDLERAGPARSIADEFSVDQGLVL